MSTGGEAFGARYLRVRHEYRYGTTRPFYGRDRDVPFVTHDGPPDRVAVTLSVWYALALYGVA